MTDKQYIKKMIVLTEGLERIASADPFDKAAWVSAVDEFHLCNCHWFKTRRRRSWSTIILTIFLACSLAWLVYECLVYCLLSEGFDLWWFSFY